MQIGGRVFGYPLNWLPADLLAGVTLAAYAIPVSLAYATLAGLPPQVGVYGYLMGGLGYALVGSSRYLAIGPTSAISLMIGGTVADMAADDSAHYAGIATAAALGVGVFCLIAWAFRLSVLVKLISDSVLTGFKAGAGITIAITQLPGPARCQRRRPQCPRTPVRPGRPTSMRRILATLALGLIALTSCLRGTMAAGPADRTWRGGIVDRRGGAVPPDRTWRRGHRRDPIRAADTRPASGAAARPGGHRRAGDGLHAARLHRGRRRGAQPSRPSMATASTRGRELLGLAAANLATVSGGRLSRGRRPVADRGERKGRRAFAPFAGVRLRRRWRSCLLFLTGLARRSAEGRTGGGRADRREWSDRYALHSRICGERAGSISSTRMAALLGVLLLGILEGSCWRRWCRVLLFLLQYLGAACRVSRAHSRHKPIFRHGAASR